MENQVENLIKMNIPSCYLNSNITAKKYEENFQLVEKGKIKLLYLSPESLATKRIKNLLRKIKISCIAVDEAHCISQWGPNFRPEYLNLKILREYFPSAVWIALTASATQIVRKDIIKSLKLENPKLFIGSFNRENIFLSVELKTNALSQISQIIKRHHKENGIIYCFTKTQVENLSLQLQKLGINNLIYHAGLKSEERTLNQKKFQENKINIIIATLAFGMGIDKSDVKYIIHYHIPRSIEQYYQEIGRSGRNGKKAFAYLLYSKQDVNRIRFILKNNNDINNEILLNDMVNFCEKEGCKRKILLNYFGEEYNSFNNNFCCSYCNSNFIKNYKQEDLSNQTYEKLISLRAELAKKENLSPYIVFHNKTLLDIADKKPKSLNELLTCYGIGKIKLKKYGKEVLKLVNEK
jgi:ATP-dependent DNA helicase RecQ